MTITRMRLVFFALFTCALGLGLGSYAYLLHDAHGQMVGFMDMQLIGMAQLAIAAMVPEF